MILSKNSIPIERSQFLGLLSASPSTLTPPEFSPRLSNVIIRDGVVMKRPGYHEFVGSNVLSSYVTDPPDPPNTPDACDDLPSSGIATSAITLGVGNAGYSGRAITSATDNGITGGNATAVGHLTLSQDLIEAFNYGIYLGDAQELAMDLCYVHTNGGGNDYCIRGNIVAVNISCSTISNINGNKACFRVYGFHLGLIENSIFTGERMMLGGGGGDELVSQIDSYGLIFEDDRIACRTVEIYDETHHLTFTRVDFSGCDHITCYDGSHHLTFTDCTRNGHPLTFHDDFFHGDALALVAAGRSIVINNPATLKAVTDLTGGVLSGEIMALVDFQLLNETRFLVALTTTRQYRYDEGAEGWVDITLLSMSYTITGVSIGAGTFSINGDHTSEFVSGGFFRVKDSTGNDGDYVTILDSAFAAGKTTIFVTSVASAIVDGTLAAVIEWTTVDGDVCDWVVATDNNAHRLIFTNGRDRPRFWDGVTAECEIWSPTYTNFVTCKTLRILADHLVLGNVTTTTNEPKIVAWSDTAEFDAFESGEAGAALIPELSGSIWKLENLKDRLIVYSSDTIAEIMFLGAPIVFSFNTLVQGTRLVSPRAIVNMGSAHLYATQENIYFFDGTPGIRAVSDRIQKLYKQNLDYEFGTRFFCFNDVAKRTIYLVSPSSETSATAFVLDYDVYDLNRFKWTISSYTDLPSCMGFFLRRTFATWVSPPDVAWEDDYGIWADEGERVLFPVRLMGSGNRVFAMDETSGLDDTETYTGSYETEDFTLPQVSQSQYGRWLELEADLAGLEVDVSYSIDQGRTWTLVETTTLLGDFQQYQYPVDGLSRTLRMKFESESFFELRWLKAWVTPSGPR